MTQLEKSPEPGEPEKRPPSRDCTPIHERKGRLPARQGRLRVYDTNRQRWTFDSSFEHARAKGFLTFGSASSDRQPGSAGLVDHEGYTLVPVLEYSLEA